MSYKWCAVPKCTNTSSKTPEKLFVSVPKNVEMRRKWLELSQRDVNDIAKSTNIFFCEDHFDMKNDMVNFYQYKMGFSQKIILKDKVLPSKFHCQPNNIKRMCDSGTSQSAFVKRQRMEFVKQCEDIKQPTIINYEPTFTVAEAFTKDLSQKCDKITLTEPVVTVEKSVQCHYINKVHIRSKAVQTKLLTTDIAISPLKPTVLSTFTSPLKSNSCFCQEKPSAYGVININKRINFMIDEKSESDVSLCKENPVQQDSSSFASVTPPKVSESSTSIVCTNEDIEKMQCL